MKKLFAFLAPFLAAAALHAAVTINFSGDQLLDAFNDPLPDGRLVLLLANVGTPTTSGGNTFATLTAGTLNIGDTFNGGLYQILGRGFVDEFSWPGEFTGAATGLDLTSLQFPNLNTGDRLAVAWFPTLSFAADFSVITGTSYGLYTSIASDWLVPAESANVGITVPSGEKALFAITAIPEPSTWAAILGLTALGLAAWRRRSSPH